MTTAIKPTKLTFKSMEAEWYNYHHTLKEISRLRLEIANPFDEEKDENIGAGSNSVRVPGDPTGKLAMSMTTHKQLNNLIHIVNTIDDVYNALPDDYKKLAKLRYWSKNKLKWEGVALEIGVSERQARRWRNNIINHSIKVIGWR